MAKLPQDMRNALRRIFFASGFETLDKAYISSVADPPDARAVAEASVRARHGIHKGQPLPPIELDEDGVPSIDFYDEIDEIADEISSTHAILVEAFTIALFHFWEKESNKWLGAKKYIHVDVMTWLKNQGSSPNETVLRELHSVVNVIKHGPGPSADDLLKYSPHLFDPIERSKQNFVPTNANLKLSKALLNSYFEAVRISA